MKQTKLFYLRKTKPNHFSRFDSVGPPFKPNGSTTVDIMREGEKERRERDGEDKYGF